MPSPMDTGSFGDLLDKRITKIFYQDLAELPDRVSEFYKIEGSSDSYERWSGIGELGDFAQFNGTVVYQSQSQGFDVTAEHIAWANGFQVTRQLYDDDRHGIWERKASALANSYYRTRQNHAARIFNNAFSVDTLFYNNSEALALCSDAHTTNSGASTATGFDNLVTSSLNAVNVGVVRAQMRGFRGDIANRMSVMPNKLVYPPELADRASEIIKSDMNPDNANNAYNPQGHGRFEGVDWEYLTDVNNWFMLDTKLMAQWLVWFDRVALDFGRAEEFDTFVAKWRAYCRYSFMWLNWRWICGAQVS